MSAFSNTGPHPNCAGCRHFRLSRDRTELFWLHKNKARTAETTIRFVELKAIAYAPFLYVRSTLPSGIDLPLWCSYGSAVMAELNKVGAKLPRGATAEQLVPPIRN